MLVQRGAAINRGDLLPSIIAIYRSQFKTAEYLISQGASVSKRTNQGPPRYRILPQGRFKDMVEHLVNHCAFDKVDEHGQTLLCYAAHKDDVKLIKYILERGAKVDGKSQDGRTPFLYAMENRSKAAAALLLKCGACIDARDAAGNTALFAAVDSRSLERSACVKEFQWLVTRGASSTTT
uniref:Uncharacterized protein n=1 Tax=Globisporangium ultimum (strain ATCC 200006 / CBS 805.95 / DAOM BR144) TaxID=431595 RepID=K3WLR0_GLOUD